MAIKVLMFGWEFPPHISGGLGVACYGITQGLLQNGVKVNFLVPRVFGDEPAEGINLISASAISLKRALRDRYPDSFTYKSIDSGLKPYVTEEAYEYWFRQTSPDGKEPEDPLKAEEYQFSGLYGNNLMREVHRYAQIAFAIARQQNHDLIHAHDWLTYLAGISAKKASGKPLVLHMHATEFDRSGDNINQNVYDIEKVGLHAADKIVAVSRYTKQIIVDKYEVPPEKIEVAYNAVEHNQEKHFQVNSNIPEKIVTFLGRVTFQKGPDYFVEAANQVIRFDKNVRFVMAGDGDMLRRLIDRVAELRIAANFHFTGFLDGDEVRRLLSISDAYVMPSVSEPFGISALEAIQANVPVIVSTNSGVSEVLRNAIKVDFWDVGGLANAILGVLHYQSLSQSLIQGGASEVQKLQWFNVGKKLKEIYLSLKFPT